MEGVEHATVVATGRPDFPNQINSVLAFPGLLDTGACEITSEVLAAAARAIADCVHEDERNASFIVPSVFDQERRPGRGRGREVRGGGPPGRLTGTTGCGGVVPSAGPAAPAMSSTNYTENPGGNP